MPTHATEAIHPRTHQVSSPPPGGRAMIVFGEIMYGWHSAPFTTTTGFSLKRESRSEITHA